MSKQTVVAFGIAGFIALVGVQAQGQSIKTHVPVGPGATTAEQVEKKAIALYAYPERAEEAAQLQRQAAGLRAPDDPKAVTSLVMSARLFSYAHRLPTACRIMEAAAERALGMGDVVKAAQAYVDAAFIAQEQGHGTQVTKLAKKAVFLTASPLLRAEEKAAIVARIQSSAQLVAAVK